MSRTEPNVLAFVLAGGEGSRLLPLTANRCKPAIPFNGRHRLVDFVLSNLVNSDIDHACVLVQYQSQGLIEHVAALESMASGRPGTRFDIEVMAATAEAGSQGYLGTADAIRQNLQLIEERQPDIVAVFSADHVYRMDVRQMVEAHLAHAADATIATLPVPQSLCAHFGIVETDADLRVTGFREKPDRIQAMPGRPGHVLASMGNYMFSRRVLVDALRSPGDNDFGHHVLPRMAAAHKVQAYNFGDNRVPGLADFEERHYWRDVGTIDAYFDAHFDTIGTEPRFRLPNPHWPIHAGTDPGAPARIVGSEVHGSAWGSDCIVQHARLDRAMLRRQVTVEADADIDHAIVMERCVLGRGARVRNAIIDADNHLPPGEEIGIDPARDRQRFHVSQAGIVVVPARHYAS